MDKNAERNAIKEVTDFVREDSLRDLVMLFTRLSGTRYGVGLSDLVETLGEHIAAIHRCVESGNYEIVDRAAWERYVANAQYRRDSRTVDEALSKRQYSHAWDTFWFKGAMTPPRKGTKARARLKAEVDELYRPGEA